MISAFALEVVIVLEENVNQDFPGVFHYEVTKHFGTWLCLQTAAYGEPPSSQDGGSKLRDLAREFFTQ